MDVVAIARRALETGPLCDACLGRTVADRSYGLTNAERGNALRIARGIAEDEPYEDGVSASCWVCEGLCNRYETYADRVVSALTEYEFDTYQIGTRPPAFVEANDELLQEDARGDPDAGERFKSAYNREVGKRVGELTNAVVDFDRPDVLVVLDLEADELDVQVNAAFVYGRYRKHERGIPQTEWPCSACDGTGQVDGEACVECDGSGYRYDRSVEQLSAPHVKEALAGTDATFHGAGREDVDARMLGTGRPFVIEVTEPQRRSTDLEELARTIEVESDGAVTVSDLAMVSYDMVERVKELPANKTYRADISFARPLDREDVASAVAQLAEATIEQRTPTRVDHRRADRVRERQVYEATLEAFEGDTATVRIRGEGGLYIKELLHGDAGRTDPSLADELGVAVSVEALDVIAVEAAGDTQFVPESARLDPS